VHYDGGPYDRRLDVQRNWQEAAEHAARLGGAILLDWRSRITVTEKGRSDLVTEADLASQEAIHEFLHETFPGHGFLGEEGLSRVYDEGSPYRWVIDPLDGTGNYVHGFPYFGVSIALEERGRLIVGVVYDPTRDEMFSAGPEGPTALNGTPVRPSVVDSLAGAMAVASLPVGTTRDNPAVQRFLDVLPLAQSLQRTGSAALNLAYVACGRIDAFWSSSLKPWDMAAGHVLVERAGGRVTRVDGSPVDIAVPDLVATNGTALHGELSARLR
jgi:myo-inositol-1(or 4)-monophosphatase